MIIIDNLLKKHPDKPDYFVPNLTNVSNKKREKRLDKQRQI